VIVLCVRQSPIIFEFCESRNKQYRAFEGIKSRQIETIMGDFVFCGDFKKRGKKA
jgi:hypothetical protein